MSNHAQPGQYQDSNGVLQKERRSAGDRRKATLAIGDDERRSRLRRHSDRTLLEREHGEMIEEALEEFAVAHDF